MTREHIELVVSLSKDEYERIKKDIEVMESKFIPVPSLYEIIVNGTPLDTVLDEMRAEIDAESAKAFKHPNWERAKALEWALSVIDKYKAESEEV